MNTRVKKRTKKYGILVSNTIEEKYDLDKKNVDAHWRDLVKKEMKNVMVAFEILDPCERVLVIYSRLKVHLVFGIKLDLTRKAQLVADGHLTPDLWITPMLVFYQEKLCK